MSRHSRPLGRRPRANRGVSGPPLSKRPGNRARTATVSNRRVPRQWLAVTFGRLRGFIPPAYRAAMRGLRGLQRCAKRAADVAVELFVAAASRLAAGIAFVQAWLRRARRAATRGGQYAADLLFPPTCPVCDLLLDCADGEEAGSERATGRLICGDCRAAFGYRANRICDRCAAPLPRFADPRQCPECRRRKLPFRAALALGEYRGPLRDAVLRTKRAAFESLTIQLGEVLADRIEQLGWGRQCDVVIPLPSHWWRRWTRGTSGPELLAERIANRLDLPLQTGWLACQRRTRKQGMLLPTERAENVRGAFRVRRPDAVRGQRVLLVDDVMTTGATLKEAATALLRARAASVHVAVLARGTGD